MFRDDYTDFSFDDKESRSYKVWITNKRDLQQNMSPNFSDSFNTPINGGITYYEGTKIDKQTFSLSCVAIDITKAEWRAITEWLSPLKIGKLRFAWNKKHYYIAKLSSAPAGSMFVKSKVDKVLGQLYIVEFKLSFTTVNDWAALGEYCEANSGTDGWTSSVFNNDYYMPAIYFRKVPDESENPVEMSGQSVIPCGDRMIFDLSNSSTAQVVIYNALGQKTEGIEIDQQNGKYYHKYYYNGTEAISEEIVIDQDISTTITLYTKPTDSLYQSTGGENVTLSVLREYDANILIANTGTDKMYPTLYSKGTTKLKKDNKTFCSFNLNDEGSQPPLVEIDNKLGILKCYGKILDLAKNTNGIRYYNSVEYNDQCFIESGRPEILKVVQISEYKKSFSNTGVTNVWKATFAINSEPYYLRNKRFFLMAFTKDFMNETNEFHNDEYNDQAYGSDVSQLKYILLDSPVIEYEKTKSGWLMHVSYYQTVGENGVIEEDSIDSLGTVPRFQDLNSQVLYISLCDYEGIKLEQYNGSNLVDSPSFTVGVQSRGVM